MKVCAICKASGRIKVRTTKEWGRGDLFNTYDKSKEDIWLCPLSKDWKRKLNQ